MAPKKQKGEGGDPSAPDTQKKKSALAGLEKHASIDSIKLDKAAKDIGKAAGKIEKAQRAMATYGAVFAERVTKLRELADEVVAYRDGNEARDAVDAIRTFIEQGKQLEAWMTRVQKALADNDMAAIDAVNREVRGESGDEPGEEAAPEPTSTPEPAEPTTADEPAPTSEPSVESSAGEAEPDPDTFVLGSRKIKRGQKVSRDYGGRTGVVFEVVGQRPNGAIAFKEVGGKGATFALKNETSPAWAKLVFIAEGNDASEPPAPVTPEPAPASPEPREGGLEKVEYGGQEFIIGKTYRVTPKSGDTSQHRSIKILPEVDKDDNLMIEFVQSGQKAHMPPEQVQKYTFELYDDIAGSIAKKRKKKKGEGVSEGESKGKEKVTIELGDDRSIETKTPYQAVLEEGADPVTVQVTKVLPSGMLRLKVQKGDKWRRFCRRFICRTCSWSSK